MKQNAIHFLAVTLLLSKGTYATDNWQQLPQPIGNLVTLWSSDPAQGLPIPTSSLIPDISSRGFSLPTTGVQEVNYICAQWDVIETPATTPWETSVSVTQITPTQTAHYVRVFYPGSSTNGPWLAPSSQVRGKTAAEIKDFLALPMLPTSIVSVDIPPSPDPITGAQYAVWTGIAGPIAGFGEGGGVQVRIVADFGTSYFPYTYDGIRYNAQPLGTLALSYVPLSGGGNPGSIAQYLDQFIPAAYSDLETVYTSLDFLNWIGFDPPLPDALNQLSPECYGSLSYVSMRNSILFSDSILNRYLPLKQCQESCDVADHCCKTSVWVRGLVDSGKQQARGENQGFDYKTYGTAANVDFQPLEHMTMGVAGSWLATNVHWEHGIGGAHMNGARAALYASYLPSNFFLDAMLSGGFTWNSAHRHIDFPIATAPAFVTATGSTIFVSNEQVNRRAHSHPTTYDVEGYLQTGFTMQRACWQVTPMARLSYFYEKVSGFIEHGADSLNLNVKSFNENDLRTSIGFGAAYSLDFASFMLIPQMQALWIYDAVFNDRKLSAGLEGLDGSFSVNYFRQSVNSFFGSAGLKLILPKNAAIFAFYELECGNHFVSNSGRVDFRIKF